MKKLRMIIINDINMIGPVQSAAHTYASQLGFTEIECFNTEVVVEELLSNVIKFDFMPGQEEEIEVIISETTIGIEIKILSKSIPLDIDKITSFEHTDSGEIVNHNTVGLGTLLVKNLVNKTHYINHGREGQEISAEIYRSHQHISEDNKNKIAGSLNAQNDLKYYVRRMKPDESAVISKLAYFAYKNTYIYDDIYYPDRVKELNKTNELMSYVAVNSDNEDLVGHCANIRDPHSGMLEIGVAFVHPDYRGHGCLNELMLYQLEDCRKMNVDGAFAHAVTTHPYSQKSLVKIGMRESALMLSWVTPVKMTAINELQVRESVLYMLLPLAGSTHKTVYLPDRHREILRNIYKYIGVEPDYREPEQRVIKKKHAAIQVKTDVNLTSKVFINSYGEDIIPRVAHTLKSLCVSRVESIFLYLPLNQPETALLCNEFETLGFFFGGIQPGFDDNDWLVLQYLNNQVYPYEKLQFATEFGKTLAAYVESCDPNQ